MYRYRARRRVPIGKYIKMRRKIFFRILGVTSLSLILFFVAGVVIMYLNGRKILRERLSTETYLAVDLLSDQSEFDALKQRYYNNDELRVTVIDAETGNVLCESDDRLPNEEKELHKDREEVKNALNGTPNAVERYSETFHCYMTYFALTDTLADGTQVVVRLAVRSSQFSSYFLTALPFFLLTLLVAIVIASALANKLSKGVSEKLIQVGDSLKSLNAGEYMPLDAETTEPEFYSVFQEINELNESTHEYIRRQENEQKKLNAVLENVAQGIVALNEKNAIVFVNGSALKLFDGSTVCEGRNIAYLIDDGVLCEELKSRLQENEFSFEYIHRERVLSIAGKRVEEGDTEKFSYILIFTDVTGAREIIRQKSEFFANASHELKTPITVMRGLTEILLEKDSLQENDRKQIERIHKESLRMTSLISDMLKLSKLERGEEEEPVQVALRDVALEVVAELADEAKTKRLQVSVEGEGSVQADPRKIFELIQNLCSNAVNYNKENGFVKIAIQEDADRVQLSVRDSGIGVEKEHIPRLCERFYRVDKSRSKKTGGTGLGLAIVKHICALYKAELSIESELGVGTCVTVKFKK